MDKKTAWFKVSVGAYIDIKNWKGKSYDVSGRESTNALLIWYNNISSNTLK